MNGTHAGPKLPAHHPKSAEQMKHGTRTAGRVPPYFAANSSSEIVSSLESMCQMKLKYNVNVTEAAVKLRGTEKSCDVIPSYWWAKLKGLAYRDLGRHSP